LLSTNTPSVRKNRNWLANLWRINTPPYGSHCAVDTPGVTPIANQARKPVLKYQAPVRDMLFVLDQVLNVDAQHKQIPSLQDTSLDDIRSVLEAAGQFAGEVLAPINQSGDTAGCHWENTVVTTPKGFKEAFKTFAENGWSGLVGPPELGGLGLPYSLGCCITEMLASSNLAWSMYPGLSHGAARCIEHNGDDWQRQTFASKILAGQWTGTMCLTEPHCGSDLGLLKTRAEPNADGTYALTGTKIFISAGEHDMAENIIHLVLARLPDAPGGTKGISMFLVPKFNVDSAGNIADRNAISCGSLEHKMGIKANATCVMNLDGAKGYLIGPQNKGLNAMFVMMNTARLEVGVQGQALIEAGYQNSLAYARDRLQMRSLTGPKRPDKPADPIIVHPDVRRMLLTQKAFSEGGRALTLWSAHLVDILGKGSDADASKRADELMSYLTPITKGVLTELAVESTYHAQQILGGHGFIKEWGLEQLLRDARITTIYEGTTQIQALDLIGRKVIATQGAGLKHFLAEVQALNAKLSEHEETKGYAEALAKAAEQLGGLSFELAKRAQQNPDEMGAAAVDYLFYSGYIVLGFLWAKIAVVSLGKDDDFHRAKRHTAAFYFARIWPRLKQHAALIQTSSSSLMAMDEALFAVV
jgi:alkylation response protein AidB-like acyl-CoA dehydrogenase